MNPQQILTRMMNNSTQLIGDMTAEEKNLLKTKLSTLVTKL